MYLSIGEYLDYENRKARKKLVDKLIDECTENVEEVKIAKITLAEDKNKEICSVHCVTFHDFYSQRWNCWLCFLFLLVLKKDVIRIKFGTRTPTTI